MPDREVSRVKVEIHVKQKDTCWQVGKQITDLQMEGGREGGREAKEKKKKE